MTNKFFENKRIMAFISIIIISTILIMLYNREKFKTNKIEKGVLNLSGYDFREEGNIKLDGQWKFYWNKLLEYKDLKNESSGNYEEIPNTWKEYKVNNIKLPGEGYATYILHVNSELLPGTLLGLKLEEFSSAYRLYINEKLVAFNGRVATKTLEEIGEYKPQVAVFRVPDKSFDIIIQVSNFHYAKGGFWNSVYMGTPEKIIKFNQIILGKEYLTLGVLLIVVLFYIAMYLLNKELKQYKYFAILCIFLAIAMDMLGQYLILRILPFFTFNMIIFIWYSSADWIIFFCASYLQEVCPSKFSKWLVKVILVISIFSQIIYCVTPVTFYSKFKLMHNYMGIINVICGSVILIIGIKKRNKYGWLNLMSMLIILFSYVHDNLFLTDKIKSPFGEILYIGILAFIFIHIMIQARKNKEYYDNKIIAELRFLHTQIKPHFIYNALNTIISISRYDIDKARQLLLDFSCYLRGRFEIKDNSQFISLEKELDIVKSYLEIEKARFEDKIEVDFDIIEDLQIRVPRIMLQPIIENAIIHGILPNAEGGIIHISVKRGSKRLYFKVEDNGVGMDEKKSREILQDNQNGSIGIANIEKRLRKLYGKGLEIKSKPNIGTQIKWSIPVKREGEET